VRSDSSRDTAHSSKGITPAKKGIKMFDISKLGVDPTAVINLDGPDGEPLLDDKDNRMSITVYGPGSKQFVKAQGIRNRAIMEFFKKGNKKMPDDAQRELDADFLAACTVSFNGFSYQSFTGVEMFRAAYLDASIGFIAEQVNKGVGDWVNFSKPLAKS